MEFEFLPCTKVIGPREDLLLVFSLMDIVLNCAHKFQKMCKFYLIPLDKKNLSTLIREASFLQKIMINTKAILKFVKSDGSVLHGTPVLYIPSPEVQGSSWKRAKDSRSEG